MAVKCFAVWVTTSVILTSAATTSRSVEPGAVTRPQGSAGESRIYVHGGRPAMLGEFPFLALLKILTSEGEEASCSGTIPSRTTVLTSAHCDVGVITAYAGLVNGSGAQLYQPSVQARHVESVRKPRFPRFYDVMVCRLNQSWQWTTFVAPVALHLSESSLQPSFVIRCQVLGFGQTKPGDEGGVAHVMHQLIGTSAQCIHMHPFIWFFSFWMCSINLENKTMCAGDSGGPAVCGSGQQWAVNMGVSPAEPESEATCLPQKTANLYVATGYFRNWILSNIKDIASSASSIRECSVLSLREKVMPYRPLWLLLLTTIEYLRQQ